MSSWDAVVDVITRVDEFSSNLTATMVYQPDGTITPFTMAPIGDPSHALAVADDPAHAVHRKLLLPHLAAKKIRAWKPSSPTLPSDYGSMACAPGASNGWAPWPTGCR